MLKYYNELSGTLDIETVLADAEVLFIAFQKMVEVADRKAAEAKAKVEGGGDGGGLRRRRVGAGGEKEGEEGEEKALPAIVGSGEGDEVESPEGMRKGEVPEIEDNLRELLH